MHLTAISFGSRGDVEPFVTVGRALARSGHHVRLLTHGEYAAAVTRAGLEFAGARGRSTQELIDSDEGRRALAGTRNPLALMRRIAAVLAPEMRLIYEDCLQAVDGADAVLAYPATFPALDVADHLRRPVVQVHHVPLVPTICHPAPAPYIRARTLTPLGNRASYAVDAWLLWQLTRAAAKQARHEVLGPGAGPANVRQVLGQRRRRAGAIVGVSPQVLAPPSDWPPDAVMCGFWWPQSETGERASSLSAETRSFLADGPPPVFLGLGSTPLGDPGAVTRLVAGAARDAGVRLVLQRGWAGLGADLRDEGIHVVGDVSYDAIFPHVAGVAHHGGAGTTALGLRHGRPTLCMPSVADQYFWGHRVAAAGAGPAPLPVARLQRARLAERLRALTRHGEFAARAGQIADGMAHEDGAAAAAAAVERFLSPGAGRLAGDRD